MIINVLFVNLNVICLTKRSILTYSGSLLRNLPRANVLGVLLVTGIYVLTNISYLAVLGTEGLLNSSAVALVSFLKKYLPYNVSSNNKTWYLLVKKIDTLYYLNTNNIYCYHYNSNVDFIMKKKITKKWSSRMT